MCEQCWAGIVGSDGVERGIANEGSAVAVGRLGELGGDVIAEQLGFVTLPKLYFPFTFGRSMRSVGPLVTRRR